MKRFSIFDFRFANEDARQGANAFQSQIANRKSQIGLTLVELLIGLAITALIGAAIASMMHGVSYGTSSGRELRELAVKNKALCSRVTAAVRAASMVLEAGDDYLVLWVYDLDGDGTPSALELQRLDYDPAEDEVVSYAPDPDAADDELALEDDFLDATDALIDSGELLPTLWARNVTAFDLTLDRPAAQEASLVGFRLTLAAGDLSDVAIAAVSLRN